MRKKTQKVIFFSLLLDVESEIDDNADNSSWSLSSSMLLLVLVLIIWYCCCFLRRNFDCFFLFPSSLLLMSLLSLLLLLILSLSLSLSSFLLLSFLFLTNANGFVIRLKFRFAMWRFFVKFKFQELKKNWKFWFQKSFSKKNDRILPRKRRSFRIDSSCQLVDK